MQLQNKRIFLVEDNIGNLAIVKMLLEAHGASVATHRSGQEVLAHLRNFLPIDLIMLDLVLPSGVTGYDIFSLIRNQAEFDGIPIVATSFLDRSKVIPEVKRRGFSGYISKPISFQNLANQIASILEGKTIW